MLFALIFAVIVIGFVLAFGSGAIQELFCFSDNARSQKAFTEIRNLVEDNLYSKSRGSSEVYTLNIPSGSSICFVNSSDPGINLLGDWIPDPVHQSMIIENGFNVWRVFCGGEGGYAIDHLKVLPEDNFCADTGADLYFENTGAWVTVEKI
jgi:hypothetical protein